MSVSISPVARKQYLDVNGNPASGSKLFFYAAGSTTKQTTYTDSAGITANSNPIILDSEGKTPYEVWYTDGLSYKEVLAPSTDTDPPTSGVLLGDNLLGSGAFTSTASQWIDQSFTPTYISATKFSVVGDQTTEFHVGRRIRCIVGAGTVYGFITASSYTSLTTITVQLDSGVLDSGLTAVSLSILTVTNPSIPNVARVFNAVNDVVNGKFLVSQVAASFAAPASGAYDLDCWINVNTSASVITVSQETDKYNSRKVLVTTADAAIAAGDVLGHQSRIEGYNVTKYIGQTFTVGFWVKATVTGIHCFSVYNGTSSYIAEYTINATNTWEYKAVTVISGTPVVASSTNVAGLTLSWANLCGATYQTTQGAWQAGLFFGTSNQVNDAATINNTFHLADVTLNLGTTPTVNDIDFERELARCQRYYEAGGNSILGYNSAGNGTGGYCPFKVSKRSTSPTIAQANVANANCGTTSTVADISSTGFTSYRSATGTGSITFSETWTAASRL